MLQFVLGEVGRDAEDGLPATRCMLPGALPIGIVQTAQRMYQFRAARREATQQVR